MRATSVVRQTPSATRAPDSSAGSDARLTGGISSARCRPAPKFSDIVNSDCNSKQQRKKTVAFRPVVRHEDDSPCGSPDHDASAADSGIGDDLPEGGGGGIFERPGFGTVAFRRGELLGPILKTYDGSEEDHRKVTDSIGSAGSLLARRHITWEDECEETSHHDADDDQTDDDEEEEEEEDDDDDREDHQLSLLLAALGLSEFLPVFQAERIDLEALSLLTEGDLKAVGMPLGPRRKLEKALRERRRILEEPGAFLDSAL